MERDADTPYEPAWGQDGWPRETVFGLDEGDESLLQARIAMSPQERLAALEGFVNGIREVQSAGGISAG